MSSNDELCETALVQRYCDGSCTRQEQMYVEGNADLLACVAVMRHDDAVLHKLFSQAAGNIPLCKDPPSLHDLIAYADNTLVGMCHQYVEQSARRFSSVREDIRLLQQLGGNPLLFD